MKVRRTRFWYVFQPTYSGANASDRFMNTVPVEGTLDAMIITGLKWWDKWSSPRVESDQTIVIEHSRRRPANLRNCDGS